MGRSHVRPDVQVTIFPEALGQSSYILQYDTDYLLTFVYRRGGAPVHERMEEEKVIAGSWIGSVSFKVKTKNNERRKAMKKQDKPIDRKSKDKYADKQETLECYESTLVNDVMH